MILDWSKPAKAMPREKWEGISADGAPPGVYVPNMSAEDAQKWRARKIGGADPRVEVRTVKGSQLVIVVRPQGRVRISMNGPAELLGTDWLDLQAAVSEAQQALAQL